MRFVNLKSIISRTATSLPNDEVAGVGKRSTDCSSQGHVLYLPKDTVDSPFIIRSRRRRGVVLPSGGHSLHRRGRYRCLNTCFCRDATTASFTPSIWRVFLGEAVCGSTPSWRLPPRGGAEITCSAPRRPVGAHDGRNRIDTVWAGATPGNKLLTICKLLSLLLPLAVLPHLEASMSARVTPDARLERCRHRSGRRLPRARRTSASRCDSHEGQPRGDSTDACRAAASASRSAQPTPFSSRG